MTLSWKKILLSAGLAGLLAAVGCADLPDADGDGYIDCAAMKQKASVAADDGSPSPGSDECDCNDADASVHPNAADSCVNPDGVDQDCSGTADDQNDADADGHVTDQCGGDDCADADATVYTGADEVCDGKDNNCNGFPDAYAVEELTGAPTWYPDADGDGYGNPLLPLEACTAPEGYVTDSTDCVDGDPAIHPGAAEVCGGVDDDCDGEIDEDFDGTDYCDSFDNDHDGISPAGGDCNDDNPSIHPGATEACDGIDNDCDGAMDEDFDNDGDGYKSASSCSVQFGGTDCRDDVPEINPGATEMCDGIDQDCDGIVDDAPAGTDADGDGYTTCGLAGSDRDCNDSNKAIHPGATETCGDGIDQDCSGFDQACLVGPWWLDQEGNEYPFSPLSRPLQSANLPF